MKTTLEIPGDVFRQSKATAAMRGESLKDFVTDALRARLELTPAISPSDSGWRRVYGRARLQEVEEVDEIVAREFETVDQDSWR